MRLRRKNTASIRVRVWIPLSLSRVFIEAKDSIKWKVGSGKWEDGCKIGELQVMSDE
jgi:hypothetical protein